MIENYLGRYSPYIYALLRIVAGFLFLQHGTQKFFGIPPSNQPPMPLNAMMTAAGAIEIVAGTMIMLGLFAGIAAFIASGEMAVAYFMVHQPRGALPLMNNGEPAVLFCFIFLYIAAVGSGVLSVDSIVRGKRATPESPIGD